MQKRIFMALLALLLLTVFAAWFVAGPHTLRPLKKELVRSRADVVLTIAKELESSKIPDAVSRRWSEGSMLRGS